MNEKKRRILIFSLTYYPHLVGGAEVALKEITDRINPTDIEFDLITLHARDFRKEKIGNIHTYGVGPKIKIINGKGHISRFHQFLYFGLAILKSLSLHRKSKYDLIWASMASFGGFAALFFKYIHTRVPFLLTLQEGDSPEHIKRKVGVFQPLYKQIFKKANHIQVISHFLAEYAKDRGARSPITVVPNGVDIKFFEKKTSEEKIKEIKNKYGIGPFDTVLITTSRLVPKNAVGDIIDSLIFLPSEVKLLILGNGFMEEFLKEKTKKLDLEKRVHFVGFVHHSEMLSYLHSAHIFIRPSLSEGFGISFIEAMAVGLPVIATPVGGIVDFLTDGVTGLMCEPKNPKSIAQKVEKLMKDKESRDYIIKNAREMVKAEYDWNLIAGEMKEIFKKMI